MDFKDNLFNKKLLNGEPINIITFDDELCCNLINTLNCACPEDVNIPKLFLENFVEFLVKVLDQFNTENYDLGTFQCDTISNNTDIRSFSEIFDNILDHEKTIMKDDSVIRLKVAGNIGQGDSISENGFQPIGTFKDNTLIVLEGKSILPVKTYYRIGITHVSGLMGPSTNLLNKKLISYC